MGYDEVPDAELIAAIPASAAAFDAFYRRHIAAVMHFLARRCKTPEDVADAAADTFVAVLGSGSTYRYERGSVAAWLYGIARNAASDRRRERGRSDALALRLQGRRLLASDDAERIAEMIDAERDAARLAPVLATVRTSEREFLDRIVDVDLTPAAASRSLGIEPSAGRRRLARLRDSVQVHADLAPDAARSDQTPPIGGPMTTTSSTAGGPFEDRLLLTIREALYSGKVREIYDAGPDHLLLVASDRISAFDVVFDEPVPDKGRVLTAMTVFWAEALADVGKTHLVSVDPADYPEGAAEDPGPARSLDARPAGRDAADRVHRARLHHRLGVEGVPGDPDDARRPVAGGVTRVRTPSRADVHPVDEGDRRPRREHLVRAVGRARR